MESDVLKKLEELERKIDTIHKSVESTRRYFKITLIIAVIVTVLPLVGLLFAIPSFIQALSISGLGGL